MAKKKELTLDEVRKYFRLMQSYNRIDFIPLKAISKELKVKPIDFWDFILRNRAYFKLLISDAAKTGWVIINILDDPMTEDELEAELDRNKKRDEG